MTDIQGKVRLVEKTWVDCLNERLIEQFVDSHSRDITMHDPTFQKPAVGRQVLKQWITNLFDMFPDYKIEKKHIFGQGDWICLECVESGTLTGAIKGTNGKETPPTGKSFTSNEVVVCRSTDKIEEVRLYYDVLGLMAQLGLGPSGKA